MKVILYIGIDDEFHNEITSAGDEIPDCKVFRCPPEAGALTTKAFELKPHIIIIDAFFSRNLNSELRALKTLPEFKSVLMAAYCKDDLEVKESEPLLLGGLHLFYMKDTDLEGFILDCFEIAFDVTSRKSEYAKAQKLEIPLTLGFVSSFTSLNSRSFQLESDLNLSDEVSLILPMASDLPALPLQITEKWEGGIVGSFANSYRVNFPYPGPWDELSEKTISPATVETWIELRGKYFDNRNENIFIFTENDLFLRSLVSSSSAAWHHILKESRDTNEKIFHLKPGLIIFDLKDDHGADLSRLSEIISSSRELEPKPLIITIGAKSDSAALRKLYEYEYLLCWPGEFDVKMFMAMEAKFLEKIQRTEKEHYLKLNDPDRLLLIRKNITVTSLSERHMTFLLDGELPYFSLVHMDLPLPAYLTIIPAEGELSLSHKGSHYRALIHGISEENLTKLRKIVNQLIYNPRMTLEQDAVATMLSQDYIEKSENVVPLVVPPKVSEHDERFNLKRNLRGKSKL